jgi:glyoxylase-like metal-dependent hydrolase (beta-lactamase superfamily II)
VRKALDKRPDALQLVDDEEIVDSVRVFPLGCHTPGSQGVLVRTRMGPVVITGDTVYKYENIGIKPASGGLHGIKPAFGGQDGWGLDTYL